MSIESLTLLINKTAPTDGVSYSEKNQGAGYHKKINPVHTAIYELSDFTGTIKLQATLIHYPGDNDWFDINDTEFVGSDSTVTEIVNFTGNFVWIRAAYELISGKIVEIRYNQ